MSQRVPDPREQNSVVLRWPSGTRSVPLARRELRKTLAAWELGAIEDAASLVLTELLTNAVRHARVPGQEVETHFALIEGGLRIEVHDASEKRPLIALPHGGAVGGWGLPLVDTLSERWGLADRTGPGKLVWAELSTKGGSLAE
ncbi:ATP-binding protein [Streptomyces sp. NPDC048629]|uniref:ATP-binding protein n=1 Tax=Streptomyces sp. NPDC048629 TaxID=3154824 RepID=UPI00343FC545